MAELNDALRRNHGLGRVVMTSGVKALSPLTVALAWKCVATYETFNEGNDPYGEHDFGSFEIGSRTFFWKIDYFDLAMEYGSEDPADPAKTTRVLTLMLADEY